MVDILLKLLEITGSNDPKIQILKGRYKIPITLKEGLKQLKMEQNGN